ncbi:polysaccharide deacetylase family protein [Aquimarina sp. AU474]|uniref:polysaccharide deacetylase family protein n=1 Tax=Aquimarina sp. AU474 TaxID=2108529 RepID=UPI000D68CCFD|nr:polysaccharide deacetylase family protein [Aquimarina sp. AU474]
MMSRKKENLFLFSVDLEDVRLRVHKGLSYRPRVEEMIEYYLDFLNKYQAKATFFTVGDIPKYYPSLINMLVEEGHEVACHSHKHLPITSQTSKEFRDDLLLNMESLYTAGAKELIGYRAPTYSLTKDTPWVFEVLTDLGFRYSSSVLPAQNLLYGWKDFGENPRKMNANLWEIPVSLRKGSFFKVPFSGGVYFRFLPFYFIKRSFDFHYQKNRAVTSYFHPYDIDVDQERFMHPEINNNWMYNQLMYFNRKKVFTRLHKIMKLYDSKIITYKSFVEGIDNE